MKGIKKETGNFWGAVFTNVSFFSSAFFAAVSVPRWERSSVCQRLKLHRERARGEGWKREREREAGGREGRDKGRQKINTKGFLK